jgi:hypothetical protein
VNRDIPAPSTRRAKFQGAELVQHLVAEQDHWGETDIDGILGRLLRAKHAVATGRAADGSPSARADWSKRASVIIHR